MASKKSGKSRHRGAKALMAVLVIVIVAVGGSVAALAADDGARMQTVPEKTILDGSADVSGMTAEQLGKMVEARARNGIAARAELVLDGKRYRVDLSKTGGVDVEATVAQAFEPYNKSALQRYAERAASLASGQQQTYRISTVLSPSTKKLKAFVSDIAAKVDRAPVDAGYSCAGNGLVTTEARSGKKVDVDRTVRALRDALSSTDKSRVSVRGVMATTKPGTTRAGQAIYVDTDACELYLYEDGAVRVSYPCTPGKAGYETPKGDWTLEYKDPAPVWQNPHSDWSQDMPETIDPGENNPLGLRALAVSCGNGIYIHGTTNLGELGSPGSHGCVRLANENIVALYDMVSAGIPIFIR